MPVPVLVLVVCRWVGFLVWVLFRRVPVPVPVWVLVLVRGCRSCRWRRVLVLRRGRSIGRMLRGWWRVVLSRGRVRVRCRLWKVSCRRPRVLVPVGLGW